MAWMADWMERVNKEANRLLNRIDCGLKSSLFRLNDSRRNSITHTQSWWRRLVLYLLRCNTSEWDEGGGKHWMDVKKRQRHAGYTRSAQIIRLRLWWWSQRRYSMSVRPSVCVHWQKDDTDVKVVSRTGRGSIRQHPRHTQKRKPSWGHTLIETASMKRHYFILYIEEDTHTTAVLFLPSDLNWGIAPVAVAAIVSHLSLSTWFFKTVSFCQTNRSRGTTLFHFAW